MTLMTGPSKLIKQSSKAAVLLWFSVMLVLDVSSVIIILRSVKLAECRGEWSFV